LRAQISERQIKALFHFTRESNLNSILHRGLLRRSEIEEKGIDYTYNDDERLDGHLNSISCSISFPNYRMFYRLRCENEGEKWVVLALSPNILIDKTCSYYPRNAATGCYHGVDPNTFQDAAAFDAMFGDVGGIKREDLNIPTHFTTDPQAEVLVFDDIEPKYIMSVVVNTKQQKERLLAEHDGLDVKWISKAFRGRKDYEHWRA
jgi:hypothetical protein